MPAQMTYNSLLEDVPTYLENQDASTVDQVPNFIMLAENRIASEMKGLGFQTVVAGTMEQGRADYAKPAYWRSPISLSYVDSTGRRRTLLLRTYEYLRMYWPNPTAQEPPKYYGDYNYENLLLAPTPDAAYSFELQYYARLTPLSPSDQESWLTENAPQLLLAATLLEAQQFLKNWERAAYWQGQYDRSLAALNGEDKGRLTDRAQNVRGKPV